MLGGMDRLLRARLLFPLASQTLSTFIASENSADLKILRDSSSPGSHPPSTRSTRQPDPGGHRHVHEGRARGKVVITI